MVYADPVSGKGVNKGFDILLSKSTDNGAHWSSPVTLNDDSGSQDQFHPTLSVESNGGSGDKVTVTWYDRRDDPANCLAYVYGTQSTDSGTTWAANVRLTSAQSDFTATQMAQATIRRQRHSAAPFIPSSRIIAPATLKRLQVEDLISIPCQCNEIPTS